jgi:outer membrane protein assembly factor BamE
MGKNVNSKSFLFVLTILVYLSGCESWLPNAHKYEISQGNLIEEKQLKQIKIGLTKEQVVYLIGKSLLTPDTSANKWTYIYYATPAGVTPDKITTMELFFENDILRKIVNK